MLAIDQFRSTLPKRPRCANDPANDNRIRYAAKSEAFKLVQPNTAGLTTWLCFDIDRPGAAMDWDDLNAPAPNIVCQNTANGHAHLLYQLETPVCTSNLARVKPLRYAEAVEYGLGFVLKADPAYGGNLVKNPLCGFWRVSSWRTESYGLEELAEYVELTGRPKRANPDRFIGLGRNCEMFERLRELAYTQVREYWHPGGDEAFTAWCERAAAEMQTEFVVPLAANEIRATARSVARWCWKRFSPAGFRAIQSARGSRKGADKRTELMPRVLAMHAAGRSKRLIAETLGLDQKTVGNWIASNLTII